MSDAAERDAVLESIYRVIMTDHSGIGFFTLAWLEADRSNMRSTMSMMPSDMAGFLRALADALDEQAAADLEAEG